MTESRCIAAEAYNLIDSIAFAFSIPVLAATLSFVTYTLTAHDFDVAVIFASFTLFQVSFIFHMHLAGYL